MKKLQITITILMSIFACTAIAQQAEKELPKGVEEIKIQTSAQCEQCKERIEKDMSFEKGIKYVNLDLDTKILTVQYKTAKTDPEKSAKPFLKLGMMPTTYQLILKPMKNYLHAVKRVGMIMSTNN
ncbi:MAG: heavy-metal-associated domain-containing protein [Bacteroidales bacterium]